MHFDTPPTSACSAALSLDWTTQKSKEDALTLVASQALKRHFGSAVQVRVLQGPGGQARGDFLVVYPGGAEVTIECKFEDYPLTWFLEPLQLTTRQSVSGKTMHIEEGWVYKSPAHFLLYVSTVTGLTVLIPRRRVLEIQVQMLQALMLTSSGLDVPLPLNAALNPVPGKPLLFNRAGVGYALLSECVLSRYVTLYGLDGLFFLDARAELLSLKEALADKAGPMRWWLDNVVLTKPMSMPRLQATQQPTLLNTNGGSAAAALSALAQLELCAEPLPLDGFRFFQAAVVEGFVSGQTKLLAQVAGTYRKRPGTFRNGDELVALKAPLRAADFAPGNAGGQGHHGFQRRACADYEKLARMLDKDGLQGRRESYLLALRDCMASCTAA